MTEEIKPFVFGGGLKPHTLDWRDYSHKKSFGSFPISELPDEYILATEILNQGATPHCTAYAACAIGESQFGQKFDPEQFYADEGVENKSVSNDGYDLRTTMATGVDIGFFPGKMKESSYFLTDGEFDIFDNIRVAMWLAKDEKACALIGTMLYKEWMQHDLQGMIPSQYGTMLGLHAMKCAGWKKINGSMYLVMQNSYGEGFGEKGLFYFPREVVNKEFVQGHYLWRGLPDKIKTVGALTVIIWGIIGIIKSLLIKAGFNE